MREMAALAKTKSQQSVKGHHSSRKPVIDLSMILCGQSMRRELHPFFDRVELGHIHVGNNISEK